MPSHEEMVAHLIDDLPHGAWAERGAPRATFAAGAASTAVPSRIAPAWRGPSELLPYGSAQGARMQYELRLTNRAYDPASGASAAAAVTVVHVPGTATLYELARLIDERHLRHTGAGAQHRTWYFALPRLDPLDGAAAYFSPFGSSFVSPFGPIGTRPLGVAPAYRFYGPKASCAAGSRFPAQTCEGATELCRLGLQAGETLEFVSGVHALGANVVSAYVRAVHCADPDPDDAGAAGAPGAWAGAGDVLVDRRAGSGTPSVEYGSDSASPPSSLLATPPMHARAFPPAPWLPRAHACAPAHAPSPVSPPPPHDAQARPMRPRTPSSSAGEQSVCDVDADDDDGRRNRRGKNAPSRQRHSARRAAAFRLKEAEQRGAQLAQPAGARAVARAA
ncbi:hypothetical protein KFE25_007671 [Diacronema lutheri]|uniref:Uncharacterized protein n=1 Tax=Diacronema lutheri TaxID=2081491 RepID=A0A8J5XPK7_DIALT|nr:hypothetical protein KFE25_007671 [Diacronema lutheri]